MTSFSKEAMRSYAALLAEMRRNTSQILGQFNELARPFEIHFDSGAFSESARHSQEPPPVQSQPAQSGYRTTLMFFLRKAARLLAFAGSGFDPDKQIEYVKIGLSERSGIGADDVCTVIAICQFLAITFSHSASECLRSGIIS
jgi:hypothetical protein